MSAVLEKKTTAKQELVKLLANSPGPLAVHEMEIFGYSQNNLATRLSEMARAGVVVGKMRAGENYKEWSLRRSSLTLEDFQEA